MTSCTVEPRRAVWTTPSPISTALTEGMLIRAPASRPSLFSSHWVWLRSTLGTPPEDAANGVLSHPGAVHFGHHLLGRIGVETTHRRRLDLGPEGSDLGVF